jgi:hypothetical protein
MMTQSLTVEGTITAVDTSTNLQSQGSTTSPTRIVPSGVSVIRRMIIGASSDAGADGSATYLLTLSGIGVPGGPHNLIIGAQGAQLVETGADSPGYSPQRLVLDGLNMPVRTGAQIDFTAEMMGTDNGTVQVIVTAFFA